MRIRKNENGISIQGIAGTYVVLLGWSMSREDSKAALGFAVHRTDHTENEAYWLEGLKVFEQTDPGTAKASLRNHPVQGYTWSDFTAKAGHDYTYRVVALHGKPTELVEEASAEIDVTTEVESNGSHAVWFNRGAAASQEYARRFNNRTPDQVGAPAFEWLSRGLWEAMQAFVAQANGSEFGLRVAAYQFNYPPLLAALKAASDTGADVRIVYDARQNDPAIANRAGVEKAGIKDLCTERTSNPSAIAHNKFIVLLNRGEPVSVWTGSTNFSVGGIFGHSNVGHEVREGDVAKAYLDYWTLLQGDPDSNVLRGAVAGLTPGPSPGSAPGKGTSELYSPRAGVQLLQWYAEKAASASSLMCMSFAFGINKAFVPMFQAPFAGLRYALLDSDGTGAAAAQTVLDLRKQIDNRFAVGNFLRLNSFDRWVRERLSGLNQHAVYIHTKYMMVDPLGDDPIVISGSANFSDASTRDNDENMLVIRGEKAVADIYATEFFRLWNHYAFREWAAAQPKDSPARPQFLKTDDHWRDIYYGNTAQSRQRQIMSGIGLGREDG